MTICFSGGSTDTRQFTQLQILYEARGRRIEELVGEVSRLQEDGDREIRILKHKLTLAQGWSVREWGQGDLQTQAQADTNSGWVCERDG